MDLLANILQKYEYIEFFSDWLEHFKTDPLAKTEAEAINWKRNTYELQHIIRRLKGLDFIEIRSDYKLHFSVKGKVLKDLGGGIHNNYKLDRIEEILKIINSA